MIWYRGMTRITGVKTEGSNSQEIVNFWINWYQNHKMKQREQKTKDILE